MFSIFVTKILVPQGLFRTVRLPFSNASRSWKVKCARLPGEFETSWIRTRFPKGWRQASLRILKKCDRLRSGVKYSDALFRQVRDEPVVSDECFLHVATAWRQVLV